MFYRAGGLYGNSEDAGQDEVNMNAMYERLRGEIENLEKAGDPRSLQESEQMKMYMNLMAAQR